MKKLLLLLFLFVGLTNTYGEENEKKEGKTIGSMLSVLLEHVNLSGYGQFGYTYNSYDLKDQKPSNTFDIKRIMFIANAEIVKNLTVGFMFDFSSAKLHEYWGQYRVCDQFTIKGGQFKTPFTIESNLSTAEVEIINGIQSVQYLAGIDPSDICYGGNAGRDLGIMAFGSFLPYKNRNLMEYRIGVFNGQGYNQRDKNRYKDIVGMLTLQPIKAVSLVGSFYLGHGYAVTDNLFGAFKAGENYLRNRWSIGTEIKTKPVYIRAEYLEGKDAIIKSQGAYAVANIHVHPKWDIIACCDYFDMNKRADAWQTNYILGAQWNLFRRCRLQAQYIYQDRGKERHGSNVVMTQIQLGF